MKKLSPGKAIYVVREYRAGKSSEQIAERLRVRQELVSAALREAGLLRGGGWSLTDAESAELLVLYNRGWSTPKIAWHFEVDPTTVRNHLLRAGMQMRPRSLPRIPAHEVPTVVGRYKEGETLEHLAAEFGLATGTLANILRRAGAVVRRSPSGREPEP
ncbi:helix-turn-helix domain-containing protein [Georgenia yuyongxinii]|uniref:Uncharacterized protein n=1 Tax=Georgenia yuyongxinii TaxID=2589797 RepID=A0A552WSA3_9MICO|nr:helix-turn-helix domain-containing protein [Georgenia yuyongxinii]TRW45594.1 hypothetical protein FJ693_08660 [Georgenia yuyongxinii]